MEGRGEGGKGVEGRGEGMEGGARGGEIGVGESGYEGGDHAVGYVRG